MSDNCRLERDTIAAAKSGQWSDSLREHVRSCADCTAAAAVAGFMERLGRTDERQHKLPDPAVVWLKSQILRGSIGVERVSRPVTIAQMFSYLVVAAGWAGFLSWKWPSIAGWMSGWSAEGIATHAASGSFSISVLATFFILSSITVLLALHTILAEE
ncbi:MAG: hypothetical protein ACXW2X_09045 [Thermoanaerobaculia bacterium]